MTDDEIAHRPAYKTTDAVRIEQVGWELFRLMPEVDSGKKTWGERWKLHNALTLFNPAPIA
jgi:galactarate dehydratase